MNNLEQIKELRNQTGVSIAECRRALESSGGDISKALLTLREAGKKFAEKKSGRALKSGVIGVYLHSNHLLAALAEVRCETDFVAKNAEFTDLANDLAMQVAALAANDADSLMVQPFIKDESIKVADVVERAVQKFGERINVGHLARLEVNLD